jgi:hypothetical protein
MMLMGNGNEPENPPKKPLPTDGGDTGTGAGTAGGSPGTGKSSNGGIKPLDDAAPPQRFLRAAQKGGAMGGFIGGLIGGLIGACICCFLHR